MNKLYGIGAIILVMVIVGGMMIRNYITPAVTMTPITRPTSPVATPPLTDTPLADTVLNLSNQRLEKTPMSIFTQTNLEELNLSGNLLTGSLPAEIRQLSNLRVLNLSHNNFTGVPAEIGQLKNLEELDLSYNNITGLPLELGNLAHLKTLNLKGTKYAVADLMSIKKNLPATTVVVTD